jgi:hypothetical protein
MHPVNICTPLSQIFYDVQYRGLLTKHESALVHNRNLVFSYSQRFVYFKGGAREGYMEIHAPNQMVLNPRPEVP